jgi:predicted Zn-dependent peptidase
MMLTPFNFAQPLAASGPRLASTPPAERPLEPGTTVANEPAEGVATLPAETAQVQSPQEEQQWLKALASQPYGAPPQVKVTALNTQNTAGFMTPLEQKTLPNGMVAYVQQISKRPEAAVSFLLPLHSTDSDLNLLETALLGGDEATKHHMQELASQGISAAVVAGNDQVMFCMKGPVGSEKQLLSEAWQRLTHPTVDESVYDAEKKLALNGMLRMANQAPYRLDEALATAAYGEGHPYASPITQEIASVYASHANTATQRVKQALGEPSQLAIVMASGLPPAKQWEALNTFAQAFAGQQPVNPESPSTQLTPANTMPPLPVVAPLKLNHPILIADNANKRVTIQKSWLAPKLNDPDKPAFDLLVSLMNGMTGPLFEELRTKEGLVYSAHARPEFLVQGGRLNVAIDVDPERLDTGLSTLNRAMATYVNAPPTPEDVTRVKRSTVLQLRESYNGAYGPVFAVDKRLQSGQAPLSLEEQVAQYQQVSLQDIQRVATQYFGPAAWSALGLSGPKAVLQDRYPDLEVKDQTRLSLENALEEGAKTKPA